MSYPKTSEMERELVSRLRDSASGNARAMAATVVALSDAASSDEVDSLVDSLMGRRPARVLHLRGGVGTEFRSWASARCALDRASRGVCFEDIYLESPDDAAFEGRLWGPFVVRDLPALLIWTLGPGRLLSCDYDCVERVDLTIIDGSRDLAARLSDSGRYCREVLSAAESTGALADLAWERSVSLRYAAARLFDGAGARDLESIRSVRISGTDRWTALLTAGWLRSRLAGVSFEVVLDDAADPRALPAVQFRIAESGGGRREASAVFSSPRQGRLEFADGRRMELSFPDAGPGTILSRLVDAPVADPLYGAALSSLASWDGFPI